jgi:cytochrome oxidase Cu insertion factor (SCO1/SenC/PrrC family)
MALMLAVQGCTATAKEAPKPATLKAGTTLGSTLALPFSLRDQAGELVSLQQMRGHVVVLTFLDATCTTECPITAQYLDWTAQFLKKDAENVGWLAMSVNPSNTADQANTFLTKNAVQVPLHILLGSSAILTPLWKGYHIVVEPGANGDVEHTLGLYVIDAQGHEREWVDGGYDPKALATDIEAVMHEGA